MPVRRLLAGSQRAPEVTGRMHAGSAFLALPSPRALRFRQPLGLARSWECGVGECSAHVADAAVFYVLGRGAGPVMRRLWPFICMHGPGRAAMAQNSPGPGLRAINGPVFVSRGEQVWRWTRTEAAQNRFSRGRT